MKKVSFILLIALIAILTSCKKDETPTPTPTPTEPNPVACVTTETFYVAVGETFYATNCSTNAHHYVWDDGDGTITNASTTASRPIMYLSTGTYTLKLTAYSESGDKSSIATVIMTAY